mmetsp:Transcript_13079/g.36120  ORF Transcript_13079/g.36120 Transcript_13079/m.36120 type:complete len:85 (-) Transcript_13079:508-762(-)
MRGNRQEQNTGGGFEYSDRASTVAGRHVREGSPSSTRKARWTSLMAQPWFDLAWVSVEPLFLTGPVEFCRLLLSCIHARAVQYF